jgi:acetate kinase
MEKNILTINGGSSSIKFALYANTALPTRLQYGRLERIGLSESLFVSTDISGNEVVREMHLPDMQSAILSLGAFLDSAVDMQNVAVIGHRIVCGVGRVAHEVVTPELIIKLKEIIPIDPEHLPTEISIIEMLSERYPDLLQVACFDTVFHQTMSRSAQLLPLPRRFDAMGLRRYGFHGLSCEYLIEKLSREDPTHAGGAVVIAHLGSGASITAIKNGKSTDTTMGFTPSGGIPMSTRLGDIDPGLLLHVMKSEGLSVDELNHLVNHESGLLGVSETSADMHDLLDRENADVRAREAVDLFCYEAKKRIGAYHAVLGGIETLIFSGGMGENAPRIRARICEGLECLGVVLDARKNEENDEIISAPSSRVRVRVMRTDEESMIARITRVFIQ